MGSMRVYTDTDIEIEERRKLATAYLQKIGVPSPWFQFLDEGAMAGVKAEWPFGENTTIRHAVRIELGTRFSVTGPELEEAAEKLKEWWEKRNGRQAETKAAAEA